MSESKIKDGNFYVVQSFMVKELGLKGLEKDVYAIIYGFTQAENQWFDGSLQYLADWTCSTKQGVLKALNSLMEKELIEKQDNMFNGVKFVKYRSTEFNRGIKQGLMGGGKQSLTNNIDKDKKENNIKHVYGEYKHILLTDAELNKLKEQYSNWEELIAYLDEAIEMKGYKYKSHYLAIKKWVADAVNKKNGATKSTAKFAQREYNSQDFNSMFDSIDDLEI